jgi:hypothetical protein
MEQPVSEGSNSEESHEAVATTQCRAAGRRTGGRHGLTCAEEFGSAALAQGALVTVEEKGLGGRGSVGPEAGWGTGSSP